MSGLSSEGSNSARPLVAEAEAVLFDLDETLLDRTATLTEFLKSQYASYRDQLGDVSCREWINTFLEMDNYGEVRKRVVYPAILREFGGNFEIAQFLDDDYHDRCVAFARGAERLQQVLKIIRASGRRLAIVTNGETKNQSKYIEKLGLYEMVDAVLISEAEGLRKPDPGLFVRAADLVKVSPQRCLFVGDNPIADMAGANAAGMSTAWLRRKRTWPSDITSLPSFIIETLPDVLRVLAEGVGSRASY